MNELKKEDLLKVLGDEGFAQELTTTKTLLISNRDSMFVTGFVLSNENGDVAIVDKSSVRWLNQDKFWDLMHGKQESLINSCN